MPINRPSVWLRNKRKKNEEDLVAGINALVVILIVLVIILITLD